MVMRRDKIRALVGCSSSGSWRRCASFCWTCQMESTHRRWYDMIRHDTTYLDMQTHVSQLDRASLAPRNVQLVQVQRVGVDDGEV